MKKNRTKKIIALFAVFILTYQFWLGTAAAAAFAGQPLRNVNSFTDVSQGDWYYSYVKCLYEDGIVNGVTENSYAPDADVKTSEVAALIARYLGLGHIAEKNRESLAENHIKGADLWYSGYIQVLCDAGIFGESEIIGCGIILTENGYVAISDGAALLIESPIKRMDTVKFIIRSFEIKQGGIKTNRLKSEISGNGNEFISGGGYGIETLDKIQYQGMIADYYDIPGEYREYFLKCYYNGIVRGNEYGEVLPRSNLKRSEMAKIIAAVLYFDLREEDLRDLPAECVISGSDYAVSSVDGSLLLKKDKAVRILKEQAKNIKTAEVADTNSVTVTVGQQNIIPAGYLCEIYVYRYENGAALEIGRVNCAANTDEYFPKQNSFNVAKTNIKSAGDYAGYVYLVLRDLNRSGEIAGAVMLSIDAQGNLTETPAYSQ